MLFSRISFFYNFINGGAGNIELPSDIRCTSPIFAKNQHAISVNGAPAPKPVKFLHQNDVTFLHLHAQQIQSFPMVLLQKSGDGKLIVTFC